MNGFLHIKIKPQLSGRKWKAKIPTYFIHADVETEAWRGCILPKDEQAMNAEVEKKI